ncbi:peptide synthetase [Agrocybe pediades]|nr:peptide synthetase [Agrocybe pediades]
MTAMLDGYAFAEWPNLSSDRTPSSGSHTTTNKLDFFKASTVADVNVAIIFVAIARVIGAYCGNSDVLLAIQTVSGQDMRFIRISWDKEDTWQAITASIASKIQDNSPPTSLTEIRQSMALKDNQFPFLALCTFDSTHASTLPSNFPPMFQYRAQDCALALTAPYSMVHPSVSSQLLSQITALVEHAQQNPSTGLSRLPNMPSNLMSISERLPDDEVIIAYSHLQPVTFAPDYLARQAQEMPNSLAVRWFPELSLDLADFPHESMDYAEFHKKSNQIARWLLRLGLQHEDRVAVCMDRNLDFHSVMMGIMRAGGCYVPIDPDLPVERKVYIAEDANAAFVVTSPSTSPPELFGSRTLYLQSLGGGCAYDQESDADLNCMVPDGLAYLLYTSGTTGNPKGCLLTHRGLAQAILGLSSNAADVRMDDIHSGRYLAVASIAFDVHLAEIFMPIALGMPLISARRSQLLENLPLYVNKLDITHLGIVPSLIEATLNASQGGSHGSDIALRFIASGGEKMSDSILDKWADHPQVRLANFYGPSEVTIGCCARYMSSSTPKANIGKPLANVSAYVVDAELNMLLRGGIGELIVEGPLVGRGYHGRDDLTSKVFLQWPNEKSWSYRTGDLVRMMPDSTIEILGRIDTQIKLRGVRIESEGISAIIRKAIPPSDAFVLDAATVLAKHPAINVDQLVSFFTWDNTVSISTRKSKKPHLKVPPSNVLQQIRGICELELPSYMRPSHFVPLSWLSLSSNGKTDEKALVAFFNSLTGEELGEISIAQNAQESRPCTNLELKIFDVLQNHVNLLFDRSRPDINVFECGLDSMGVIRFAAELKQAFSVKISASEIMKAPRIVDIASRLSGSPATQSPVSSLLGQISVIDAEQIYLNYDPASIENILLPFAVQEGVLSRSAAEDSLYVQHVLIACRSETSLSKLRSSWQRIVEKNEILRTVFHFGRSLTQVVLKPEFSPLAWEDRLLPALDQTTFRDYFLSEIAPSIAATINQNVSTIAPYRLSAFSSDNQNFLVLSIHHALFDGTSLPRIFAQVERDYLELPLIPVTASSDILDYISTTDLSEAKTFWKKYFSGYRWSQAPLLSSLPAPTKRFIYPFKEPLSSIRRIAASYHVTIQALLTCVFAKLLATHVYGRRDVVFGVLRSGRLLPLDHIEDSISPLVSVLPVRVNFRPELALDDVQSAISQSIEYEHVPLGKLQSWIRPGKPLFEVLFSLSVNETRPSTLWDIIESEPPKADYPLAVEIVLEPATDSATVKAAWLDQDLFANESPSKWIQGIEGIIFSRAEESYITQLLGEFPCEPAAESEAEPENQDEFSGESPDDPYVDVLRRAIADFMGFDSVLLTPSTSLISMGLDSIKSVGLAKSLDRQGFKITSTDLLRHPTLLQLTGMLRSRENSTSALLPTTTSVLLEEAHVPGDIVRDQIQYSAADAVQLYPTTALQTGMLSQTLSSSGQLYVHAFPLRIAGSLDLERLHQAWETAVENISVLRTTFHFSSETGQWLQAVHSSPILDWSTIPLSGAPPCKEEIRTYLATVDFGEEASFKRPPFRLRLFQSVQENVPSLLLLVMHHALYDGISIGKLLDVVRKYYMASAVTPQRPFHELLPHFMDQERRGTLFWSNRLRKYKPARLPLVNLSLSSFETCIGESVIPVDPTRIKQIISRAGVTAQCIGQAAWAKLLCKYTGCFDIIFGHTVSGRGIPGAEDVIGPVLNTIPFCIRLEKEVDNIELLKAVHRANLDALPWQQASVRAVQKELKVDQIWDSLFLFQHAESDVDPLQLPLWSFDDTVFAEEVRVQYPLNVEMLLQHSSISIKCASQARSIDQHHLQGIIEDLHQFIGHILRTPEGLIFEDFAHASIPTSTPNYTNHEDKPSESISPLPSHGADSIPYQSILTSLTNAPLSLMRMETPLSSLGIDSIMAIQIVGKFRQTGMKLTAADVVTSRTIGEMLAKIVPLHSASVSPGRKHAPSVDPSERASICLQFGDAVKGIDKILTMSSGMKWLIGAWKKSAETRFQHVFAFSLPTDVDAEKLELAWYALVERHSILRSTFALAEGHTTPRLVMFNAKQNSWKLEDISEEPDAVISRMKAAVSNPLPLSSPPARALFLRARQNRYLILHLHHFQYDAWSLQLIIHDLSCLYRGLTPRASNSLEQFLDHCHLEQTQLSEQQEYWQRAFPVPFTPAFLPAGETSHGKVPSTQRLIRTNMACITNSARLEERALQLGVSLQSIFLACWASVQARASAASSATFGLWHSGRTGSFDDIANLAVPCTNVLPLHVPELNERSDLLTAEWIQKELQRRTSVIEQSDLVQVNEWVGVKSRPLCNVTVNIIKVASSDAGRDTLFGTFDAPYFVPDEVSSQNGSRFDDLAIARLINDDLMVDIASIPEKNTVMMSLDAAASFLTKEQADSLMSLWATCVQETLGLL